MKVPIRISCEYDYCQLEVRQDDTYHAVIAGKIFRFCSCACRSQFRRTRVQVAVVNG